MPSEGLEDGCYDKMKDRIRDQAEYIRKLINENETFNFKMRKAGKSELNKINILECDNKKPSLNQ